jgi:hypothetical protein
MLQVHRFKDKGFQSHLECLTGSKDSTRIIRVQEMETSLHGGPNISDRIANSLDACFTKGLLYHLQLTAFLEKY